MREANLVGSLSAAAASDARPGLPVLTGEMSPVGGHPLEPRARSLSSNGAGGGRRPERELTPSHRGTPALAFEGHEQTREESSKRQATSLLSGLEFMMRQGEVQNQALLHLIQRTGTQHQSATAKPLLHLKGPPLKIPSFSGDILSYAAWRSNVQLWLRDVPASMAYQQLLSLIEGEPRRKVESLASLSDAYGESWRILDRAYGRAGATRCEALSRLRTLKPVETDLAHLEPFLDAVQGCISVLRSLGTTEEQLSTLIDSQIYDKLPPALQQRVNREIGVEQERCDTPIDLIMEILDKELRIHKKGTSSRPGAGAREERERRVKFASTALNQTQGPIPPSPVLSSPSARDQKKAQGQAGQGGPERGQMDICVFCQKGRHPPNSCRTVPSLEGRRKVLEELRLCFICLRTGHMARDCRAERCGNCRHAHHVSLCPRLHPNPSLTSPQGRSTGPAPSHSPSPVTPPTSQTTTSLAQSADQEMTVILNTFQGSVSNPFEPRRRAPCFVFLDTGAMRSCILRSIAEELKLPVLHEETVETYVFGGGKEKMRYSKVPITLYNLDGTFQLPCHVYAVDSICAPLLTPAAPWSPQKQLEIRSCWPDMVNFPPSEPQRRAVDLVLGLDLANEILLAGGGRTYQVDGSVFVRTTPIGPLLSGGVLNSKPTTSQLCMMTAGMGGAGRRRENVLRTTLLLHVDADDELGGAGGVGGDGRDRVPAGGLRGDDAHLHQPHPLRHVLFPSLILSRTDQDRTRP